ncbi:MAG: nitrilase family protein [Flavobacteriales bacterium CG_4_9_14_3_um_filter_32_8]|nr:MAG: nitrilase family protein [Flavobacteriales bacterium CG_4_9_14_3_um_filter_32_8]
MNLKITIIQSELHWENAAKNLVMFTKKIASINEATDIIVLPEMFTTGFTMKSEEFAETMTGKTVTWMKAQAKKSNSVIIGSLIIEEHEKFFNRLVWMQPDGDFYTYDKRHLFRMAKEHENFSAGNKRLIVDYKGWKICPLVCYDLRFPVWSRNKPIPNPSRREGSPSPFEGVGGDSAYDCLIYIANWPEVRKAPWSKLLEARAIENQCYVVGVNRVGIDGTNHVYSGNSVVINPKGEKITTVPEHKECTPTVSLSLKELTDFRALFPVGLDGDEFEVIC